MNGPQSFPQPGAPIMPNKHETAPKWSEEDLEIANDFVSASRPFSGSFLEKRDNAARSLGYRNYMAMPEGVRSAISHLGAEARKRNSEQRAAVEADIRKAKEQSNAAAEQEALKRKLALAEEEWWKNAEDPDWLQTHGTPEEEKDLQ
jgi:hypothetical protein